jgi:hypothetical protein
MPVASDASAALTAWLANPGLPTHGVIVLCDFGGSGTSITLANTARDFSPFGETVRFPDFSGDHIDQALLTHVVGGLVDASKADPSSTAMVGSLVRLLDECRRAKERLSSETATAVVAELPGHRGDIRVTRTELEDLMAAPLSEFLVVLDETLERYGVPTASVSAVASAGGGARIPLITQRLSEHLRAPVVTTPHPQLTAAEGAALIAHRGRVADTATTLTPSAPAAAAATDQTATEPSTALPGPGRQHRGWLPYTDVTTPPRSLPPRGAAGDDCRRVDRLCRWPSGSGHRRRGPGITLVSTPPRPRSMRHGRFVRPRARGVGAFPAPRRRPPSHGSYGRRPNGSPRHNGGIRRPSNRPRWSRRSRRLRLNRRLSQHRPRGRRPCGRLPCGRHRGKFPQHRRSTRARAAEPAPAPHPSTPAPEARAPAVAARVRAPRPLPKPS